MWRKWMMPFFVFCFPFGWAENEPVYLGIHPPIVFGCWLFLCGNISRIQVGGARKWFNKTHTWTHTERERVPMEFLFFYLNPQRLLLITGCQDLRVQKTSETTKMKHVKHGALSTQMLNRPHGILICCSFARRKPWSHSHINPKAWVLGFSKNEAGYVNCVVESHAWFSNERSLCS